MADKVYVDNTEATAAWNTVLFDRFSQYRHIFVVALKRFGDVAIAEGPPRAGDRILDIGCGFGDTAQQLAQVAGPSSHVVGVDAAERFIDAARDEAARAGVENVEFVVADVQTEPLSGPYDYAFARMGTMFFANPVAALRNVRQSLRPDGTLTMVVWRRKLDNEWMQRSEEVVDRLVPKPNAEESDALTCGPGPFSMANADTTSDILRAAGFERIALRRVDLDMLVGQDAQEAVEVALALGPAAETVRLAGDDAERVRPLIERDLRALAGEYTSASGAIVAPASAWVVSAHAPAAG
ncbi:tRNA methyltransferase [Baekduia alba]|uniref:class I SAM-dependent methyltransferase n=1 Tax=Baekduia alba TaxID=2997333 RepID=UPI00234013ED|nr:class I SAM-dependent methyltransferase [Baekduia alba]WCB92255.1 tRNA methyltransferase [Baekduia alba]